MTDTPKCVLEAQAEIDRKDADIMKWVKIAGENQKSANLCAKEIDYLNKIIVGCNDLLNEKNAVIHRYREALEYALETVKYVKKYVDQRGLSAEDDCVETIKMIEEALTEPPSPPVPQKDGE
jgi:hypothetical protein